MQTTKKAGVLVSRGRNSWTVTMPNTHHETGGISRHTVTGYGEGEWEKHCPPGTPVVDTRTIPEDKILQWCFKSPLVDPDLEGVKGENVEAHPEDLMEKAYYDKVRMLPKKVQTFMLLSNSRKVSVEEYVKLAEEWGATITYTE